MRAVKWIAGLLAGAALLAILGVVGLTYALDAGMLTPRLLTAIEGATGRRAALGGVSLHLGLTPRVVVEGTSLANLPGGSRPAMAQIRRLEASLAILPLLRGDIGFRSISIEGADILLERLPDGTPNWHLHPAAPEAAAPATPSPAPRAETPRRAVAIGEITLEDSRLTLPDPRFGTIAIERARIEDLAGETAERITARLVLHGVTLDFTGAAPAAPAPLRARLAAGRNSLAAEGRPGTPVTLDAALPDAAALRPLIAALAPDLVLPATLPEIAAQLRLGPDGQPVAATLQAGAADLAALHDGLALTRLEASLPAPDRPAELTLAGSQAGLPFTARITLDPPAALLPGAAEAPLAVTLEAEAAGARAEASGRLARPRALAGVTADIRLTVPDLAALAPVLTDPPPLRDATIAARITAAGPLSGPLAIESLRITGPDLAAEGALRLTPGDPPGVEGELRAERIDIDALTRRRTITPGVAAQAPSAAPPPSAAQAAARVIPDIRLPIAATGAWRGRVALNAALARIDGMDWRGLRTVVANQDGVLRLDPFNVTSPGGPVRGTVRLDARQTPPAVALTLRSEGRGLDLAAMRRAQGEAPGIEGRAEVILDLTARGATTRALAATLSGEVGIAMIDGRLAHAGMLRLGPDLLGMLLPGAPREGLPLRCLALRLTAEDGIANTRALLIETTNGRIEGTAAFNLRDETLAARLLPDVQLFGVQVRAPVGVGGTFAAPRVGVDPAAALGQVIRDTAANRLWQDPTVEWLRGRITGRSPAGGCAEQLRLARMGAEGPVPDAAPVVPIVPRELQGPARDLLRGLGGILGGGSRR